MARYARPGKTVVSVGGFNGIDVTSPGDSLCPAYYMKNFRVTERRELKKRPGYRKLLSGISADSVYAANVAGVDRLIYKSGTVLHATDVLSGADVNLDTHSGASVSYFSFGGKVYVYGFGFNYAFDGEAFKKIEPYIPTVAVTCAPSGGGTVHESLNVLSPYARISYSPDGQSTVYKLPSYAYDVTGVKIDGEETGGYYFDRRTKTLVFDEPPAGGVPDSLEVTFRLSDGMILGMPYIGDRYCVYGGDRDTRVFAYGVGGTLRYSDVTDKGPDPTYFPADNFIEVGDGSEEVTALVRHYDRLIVFTERQTWFLSAKEITYSGETKISYPCSPLNSVVGCAGGAAAYIDNRPVTLSRDGIYVFGQSTVRDERLAKRISDRVTPYIPYSFLCRAKAYDNEYDRELWLYADSRVVIYNYGIDAFYIYENVPADLVFGAGGRVAFLSGTDVFVFDGEYDDGKPVEAVWESCPAVLDRTVRHRRVRRVSAVFTSETGSVLGVTVTPNRGAAKTLRFTGAPSDTGFDFGHIDFTAFSFVCGRRPTHTEQRLILGSFESASVRLTATGEDLTVRSVALTADGA